VTFTSVDRVRDVIHNFTADGFDSLRPKYAGGRPPKLDTRQRAEIKKIALSRPVDHDLRFSTWSLSKLADFLVAEGVVEDISHEGLRVILRAEGVSFPGPSRHGRPALTRTTRRRRTGSCTCTRSPTAKPSGGRVTRTW
jgi:transposase